MKRTFIVIGLLLCWLHDAVLASGTNHTVSSSNAPTVAVSDPATHATVLILAQIRFDMFYGADDYFGEYRDMLIIDAIPPNPQVTADVPSDPSTPTPTPPPTPEPPPPPPSCPT